MSTRDFEASRDSAGWNCRKGKSAGGVDRKAARAEEIEDGDRSVGIEGVADGSMSCAGASPEVDPTEREDLLCQCFQYCRDQGRLAPARSTTTAG